MHLINAFITQIRFSSVVTDKNQLNNFRIDKIRYVKNLSNKIEIEKRSSFSKSFGLFHSLNWHEFYLIDYVLPCLLRLPYKSHPAILSLPIYTALFSLFVACSLLIGMIKFCHLDEYSDYILCYAIKTSKLCLVGLCEFQKHIFRCGITKTKWQSICHRLYLEKDKCISVLCVSGLTVLCIVRSLLHSHTW